MKSSGIVFKARQHAIDPGNVYGDVSRNKAVCTPTALTYTQIGSIWVPTWGTAGANVAVDNPVVDTGDITLSMWLYPIGAGIGTSIGRIMSNGQFRVFTVGPTDSYQVISDGTTTADSAVNSLILNTWVHLFITRTGAGVTNIYLDTILSGAADQDSGTPVVGTNLYIGNRSTADRTYQGYNDALEIWGHIPDNPAGFVIEKHNEHAGIYGKPLI